MAFMLNENPYLRERDELLAHLVDDGTISAEAAAKERCRLRGICSEPDCEQAIDGWCAGCGAKLCASCLSLHAQDGCEDAHAAARWCVEEFPDGHCLYCGGVVPGWGDAMGCVCENCAARE